MEKKKFKDLVVGDVVWKIEYKNHQIISLEVEKITHTYSGGYFLFFHIPMFDKLVNGEVKSTGSLFVNRKDAEKVFDKWKKKRIGVLEKKIGWGASS